MLLYMAICTCRSGSHCLFLIWQCDCSNSPPNVGVVGSNTPLSWLFCWSRSYENVPMDHGIILCVWRTVGFDLILFTRQIPVCWGDTQLMCFIVFAKFHHAQVEKGFYFVEIPISERFFLWDSHFVILGSLQAPHCLWSCRRRFFCLKNTLLDCWKVYLSRFI